MSLSLLVFVSGCDESGDVGSTRAEFATSERIVEVLDASVEDASVPDAGDEDGGVDEDCEDDIEWPEITPVIPVACDDPSATPGIGPDLFVQDCDEFSLRYCTFRYIKDRETGEWKMTTPRCIPEEGGTGDIVFDFDMAQIQRDDGDITISCDSLPVPWGGEGNCECTINPVTGELECSITLPPVSTWPGAGNCCTIDGVTHCDIYHDDQEEGQPARPWTHAVLKRVGSCFVMQTSNLNATGRDRISMGYWMLCCKDCPDPPDPPGTCTCHPECGTNGLPPCCPAELCNPPGECSCDPGCGMNGLPPCCPIEWCQPPPCGCLPACINSNSCCPLINCPPPPGCSCDPGCGMNGFPPCCPVQICPPVPPGGCQCDPFGYPIGPDCGRTYFGPGLPTPGHACAVFE